MAIKLSNIAQLTERYKIRDFYFNDLHLDLEKDGNYSSILRKKMEGNDIKMDYDESAIKNSLKNLFNTKPGERFLFPAYGLDLSYYLFEPITENLGRVIGERIMSSIKNFEPRVTARRCDVIGRPEDNQYDITLTVEIPIFNSVASINTILDTKSQSFIFVETNRTR